MAGWGLRNFSSFMASGANVLWSFKVTVMILSFGHICLGKQCRPRSDCSSLIRGYTVCHSVCIVWTHYSIVEPHSSNFRVITTNFLGVRIFRKFTVLSESVVMWQMWQWYCPISLSVVMSQWYCQISLFVVMWQWYCPITLSVVMWQWYCPISLSVVMWQWYCPILLSVVMWQWYCLISLSVVMWQWYLEVITWPPLRYQAYRPGSSILARGPLGLRASMECRADMPGNATMDMF